VSFLSGLSNIFHGIGHVFDGGDDDAQKKRQQQQQQQGRPQTQQAAPTQTPVQNQAPGQSRFPGQNQNQNPVTQLIQQPQQQPDNSVKLFNGVPLQKAGTNNVPQAGSYDPNSPLVKANTTPAVNAHPVSQDHRNIFQKSFDQINPFDSDRSFKNGTPTKDKINESGIHQFTHNGAFNAAGSLINNVVAVPSIIDTARLGLGEATGNQTAIDNATTSLAKNLPRFLPIGAADSFKNGFGKDIATAALTPLAERSAKQQGDYVRKINNGNSSDPRHNAAVEAAASGTEANSLEDYLRGNAGITSTTPLNKVVKKVGGDAASTAANIALFGLPAAPLLDAEGNAVLNAAGKTVLKSPVKNALASGATSSVATVGGTLGANPNASSTDLIKAGASGFLPGAILPTVLHKFSGGKAVAEETAGQPTAPNIALPDEVTPGIKSANPNHLEDAVKQTTDPARATPAPGELPTDNTPAYQRKAEAEQARAGETAATNVKATELGVGPNALDHPTFMHNNEVKGVIQQGTNELNDWVNQHPEATPQEVEAVQANIKAQVMDHVERLQAARQVAPTEAATPVPGPEPVAQPQSVAPETSVTPAAPSEAATAQAAQATPVANPALQAAAAELQKAKPEDLAPGQPAPAPISTAPSDAAVPTPSASGETVQTAPGFHDQLVKSLGDDFKGLKGKAKARAQMNIEDLTTNATGKIANLSDEDLLKTFQNADPQTLVNSNQAFALARAAVARLAKNPGDEASVQTVANLLDGMDAFASKAGQGLRLIASETFDSMPLPMKVRALVKAIDRANSGNPEYEKIGTDPARLKAVNAQLEQHLAAVEDAKATVSAIQGKIQAVVDNPNSAEKGSVNDLRTQLAQAQNELQARNGDAVQYYDTQVPGKTGANKINDFARNMMLASGTGRANDIATTAANVTHLGLSNLVKAPIAKLVNWAKPGTVTDTGAGLKAFGQGTVGGVKEGIQEFGSQQHNGDLLKATQSNTGARTGLTKATNPILRTIQAATEFATHASEGVRSQHLYQLANKEGQELGYKGSDLKNYSEARSLVPSRAMSEAADQLHASVNNLNDNPISRALGKVAKAIDDPTNNPTSVAGKVGQFAAGTVKNQIIPFTSWLGGNIWNTITDKNVVANGINFARSAAKGDVDGAITNLSKGISNAAQGYALGYWLTQNNYITNKDANGFNDAGAYVHIGGRYIPVGFFGFFAPSIIMGNATYQGIHSTDGNPAKGVAGAIETGITNLAKSTNVAGTLGVDSTFSKAVAGVTGGKETFGQGAAQAGANAAGQYIPAGAQDVNAVLNNGLKIGGKTIIPDTLNKTHEAADTKVVNPNSKSGNAKDLVKSAEAGLLNKVPGVSQLALPRKAGKAASDLIDRTDHGNRDTNTTIQTRNDATTLAATQADLKARGIPDPTAKFAKGDSFDQAIQNRIENKKYDQAIQGLQAKLTQVKAAPGATAKAAKAVQDKIDQVKFLQSGGETNSNNGTVYEKGSKGKITSMEQKDFDYKTANDQITSAKNSGDVTSFATGTNKLLDNVSWQLKHADLTPANRDSLIQKAVQLQEEFAKAQQYGGFTKPKHIDTYVTPQITGAKDGWVKAIQEGGAKHGVDINAMLAVAAQEGLGGGVGDGGHAFGPFQMNDAGGVLTGKYKSSEEARAYAESPAGIDDAIQQIAKVAKGKTGAEAIKAIVNGFERSADQPKEIANALALYTGGQATLSDSGGVASLTPSDAATASAKSASTRAADLIKSNTVSAPSLANISFGNLSPTKVTSKAAIPTIQQVKAGDLIKQRTISVSKVK
jgi:hypothetical protein